MGNEMLVCCTSVDVKIKPEIKQYLKDKHCVTHKITPCFNGKIELYLSDYKKYIERINDDTEFESSPNELISIIELH